MPVSARATVKQIRASCLISAILFLVIFTFQFSWGLETGHTVWLFFSLHFLPAQLLVTLSVSGAFIREQVRNAMTMTMIKL